MGYTHYFTNKKVEQKTWDDFTHTVDQLIKKSTVKICGGFGEGLPMIAKSCLSLNGANNDSHETFMIDNENAEWSFCKTAGKPYDEVVVASLIYGEKIGVIESWSSDGDGDDFDDGRDLLKLIGK